MPMTTREGEEEIQEKGGGEGREKAKERVQEKDEKGAANTNA